MVDKQQLQQESQEQSAARKREHDELKKHIKAASRRLRKQKNVDGGVCLDVISTIINASESWQTIEDAMPLPIELLRSLRAWQIVDNVYIIPKLTRLAIPYGDIYRVVRVSYFLGTPQWHDGKEQITKTLQQLAQ